MTRSVRPSAFTRSTAASARDVARTIATAPTPVSEPQHLEPELLFLRGGLVDADVFRLDELEQAPGSQLPPDPGLLEPAERCRSRDQVVVVDPYRAGLQPLRHREGAWDVPGPHPAGQAVHRVVRHPDGVFHRLVPDDRENRPEDLLLRDPHRVVHVAEDGGLDVVAALGDARRDAAAR